jgi:hypothetical protein
LTAIRFAAVAVNLQEQSAAVAKCTHEFVIRRRCYFMPMPAETLTVHRVSTAVIAAAHAAQITLAHPDYFR